MNVILFDVDPANYYPLSYTRPISYFRIGILTIIEKWQNYYKNVSVETQSHLKHKYLINKEKDNLWINSKILPSDELLIEIKNLEENLIAIVIDKNKRSVTREIYMMQRIF